MKAHHLLTILLASTLAGCGMATDEQEIWAYFGDPDSRIPEYANFYEQFNKYPDYAFAEYDINEVYDPSRDQKYLRASLRECRSTFRKAYLAKKLQRQNPERGVSDTFQPVPGYSAFLPFRPRYVVVALKNNAEHKGASTFAASYKVAYIIPIELVLSDHYDFENASQAAYVDRDPFHFDAPSPEEEKKNWSPSERYKWLAIERHEALLKNKATKPDEDPSTNGTRWIRSATNRNSSAGDSPH